MNLLNFTFRILRNWKVTNLKKSNKNECIDYQFQTYQIISKLIKDKRLFKIKETL